MQSTSTTRRTSAVLRVRSSSLSSSSSYSTSASSPPSSSSTGSNVSSGRRGQLRLVRLRQANSSPSRATATPTRPGYTRQPPHRFPRGPNLPVGHWVWALHPCTIAGPRPTLSTSEAMPEKFQPLPLPDRGSVDLVLPH